ncbi:NmrA family NAD(P)-binding protein [Glycomyces sp. NPDC046736]|uniref:NmrA family NAD(P)-binding protein n=1 Tax=Glycomyces sp. NPDC046736 TaxID=3155615 RepID=UPI0033F6CBFC
MQNETILVTGATGKVGRRLTAKLQAEGRAFRAVSRSTEIPFDWHKPETWDAAFAGITAAYLIPPDEPVPAEAVVAAAVKAGVRRLVSQSGRRIEVLTAAAGVSPDEVAMHAVQNAVQASGLEWTVLQANNFNQNFDEGDNRESILAGELSLPLDNVPEPFIDVEDIAEVAAAVLTRDGHTGRVYELSGPEAVTHEDAIAIIAKATGREIAFRAATPEGFVADLRGYGVPEPLVAFLDVMYAIMRDGALAVPADGVQEVLGREPVAFADWAARAAAAGAWDE